MDTAFTEGSTEMGRTRSWIAVAVALSALAGSPVRAQNEERFANRLGWDFNSSRDRDQVKLNGSAHWVTEPWGENLRGRLRLTSDFGQAASAFIRTPFNLSDYEVDFTFDVRRANAAEGLADGFTFVAQTGDDNEIGASGGALGYAGSDLFVLPSGARGGGIPDYSYAVEFNSYPPQGLPGAAETVGIDILGLRTRFNQTPLRFVEQGGIRVKIRVKPEGLTVLVFTGAGFQTILQSPARMNGFFTPPRRLYLGFTAGTGGVRQIVDIFGLSLSSNQRL
jgi:hypothetical protein